MISFGGLNVFIEGDYEDLRNRQACNCGLVIDHAGAFAEGEHAVLGQQEVVEFKIALAAGYNPPTRA